MIVYCAVPGCSSNSKTTDYTFHRFPKDLILRARWILSVQRPVSTLGSCPVICRRHFEEHMLSGNQGKRKGLARNAVPTLFLPPKWFQRSIPSAETAKETDIGETLLLDNEPENQLEDELLDVYESSPLYARLSSEAVSEEDLIACRACLAADGRLYAISDSGLEDAFVALTGVEMPEAERFPRHLCAFCMARLSKCAAFRDSCHRSTALLRSLSHDGALTMDDFKTVDRHTHKLTNGLEHVKVCHFQTHPVLEILPLPNKNDDDSQKVPSYTKEEYLESDDGAEYLYINDSDDNDTIYKFDDIQVESIEENCDVTSDIDDVEYKPENYTDVDSDAIEEIRATVKKERKIAKLDNNTDKNQNVSKKAKTNVNRYLNNVDSDTSEETIEMRKKVKKLLMKKKSAAEVEDYPTEKSVAFFAKQFNCTAKLLSKEEQKQQVDERKRKCTTAFCCDLCGRGFKKKSTLMTHMSSHDPSLPHECEICHLRYRHRRILAMHQQSHRAIFTCNECGCTTQFRKHVQKHHLMHSGAQYPCPHCDAVYSHQTSRCNHVRMQHPGAAEPCERCGETFAPGRGLMLHQARAHGTIHKPDVTLKCAECDVTFLDAKALRKHVELGAGVPHAALWPCAVCGDSCDSESALAAHAAKHQAERHHCDECDKTFISAESFELHVQRKHLNRRASEAPFRRRRDGRRAPALHVCEICGNTLKNVTLMRYHMNAHLGLKPFQCELCPKAYTSRLSLNQHTLVHTGERPFQCDQCPQSFRLRSNLVKHITHIHLQQPKLVTCVACNKTLCAGSLALHVRTVHQKQKYVRKRDRKRKLDAEP